MEALQHWEYGLSRRGILGAAKQFGWRPDTYGGFGGWVYPVYNAQGETISRRFKNFDSGAPKFKYAWPDSQPDGCKYYLLPGAVDAMRLAGQAIIASGEPDVLAYRSAGAKNVVCWFGEGQMPATFAADLISWGVHFVDLAPDRDEAGMKWAQHIVNAISEKGIGWRVYELPQPLGSKYDINRLWVDCKFDETLFWNTFILCNELVIKPAELKPENLPLIEDGKSERDYPPAFYAAIESALGVEHIKGNGYSKNIKCPFHDDQNASAGWDHEKHILKCFVCKQNGEWFLAKEVAAKLGIRPETYYPPRPIQSKPAAPTTTPAGKPKILYSWDEGTDRLLAQLDGDVPIFEPLVMPFSNIRALGGFAKRTKPGKVIAIVGDSGMGKTSLIETIVDAERRAGFHGVLWGPEWSYDDYVQRAVQRNGGPSYEALEDHKAYLSEQLRSVPENNRTGKLLTQAERNLIVEKTTAMKAWPGKLMFVEKMNLPIELVIRCMQEAVDQFHANGKRIAFVVLDYAQLVGSKGDSDISRLNHILDMFKAFCVDRQLVGIVGSQMTKADGRAASSGTKGSLHAMVNARTDVFNLAMVLTRSVDENGKLSQAANCRIVKNSLGRTGDVDLYLDPDKLRWYDGAKNTIELNIPTVPVHGRDD